MKITSSLAVTMCFVSIGCTGSAPNTSVVSGRFQISESPTELSIIGVDAQGAVTDELSLELGRFAIPDDGRIADGRKLTIRAHGIEVQHVSEGHDRLLLPFPQVTGGQFISDFVLASEVSPVLSRWGVGFDLTTSPVAASLPPPPPGEIAYVGGCGGQLVCTVQFLGNSSPHGYEGTCTFGVNASCSSNVNCKTSAPCCAQFTGTSGHKHEYVVCDLSGVVVERACVTGGGSTECGTAGPAGCAVCWSQDTNCGTKSGGWVGNSGGYAAWQTSYCDNPE